MAKAKAEGTPVWITPLYKMMMISTSNNSNNNTACRVLVPRVPKLPRVTQFHTDVEADTAIQPNRPHLSQIKLMLTLT
jgi:hypothetical protein